VAGLRPKKRTIALEVYRTDEKKKRKEGKGLHSAVVEGRGGRRGPEEKGRYNMKGGCHILELCPRFQDPVGGKKGMDIFEAVSQK